MTVVHGTTAIAFVEIGAKGAAFVVLIAKACAWLLRLQAWLWITRSWLLGIRAMLGFLRRSIANANPVPMTPAKQERLQTNAAKMGAVADRLFMVHDLWENEIHPRLVNLPIAAQSSRIVADLEDIGCSAEDISESLALAASPAFHESVQSKLKEAGVSSAT